MTDRNFKQFNIILLLGLLLLGISSFLLLFTSPVAATQPLLLPTPTPNAPPYDTACHLHQDADCWLFASVGLRQQPATQLRLNPPPNVTGVPTYTLISVAFPQPLDAATVNRTTFFISDSNGPVTGRVNYIPLSRMAIFSPTRPLQPGTVYSATLTAGVRTEAGLPVTTPVNWSFTIAVPPPPAALQAADVVLPAGSRPSVGGLTVYFGDLHSHTGYSDGVGSPGQAFTSARASGVDFFAVTDHAFLMNDEEWQDLRNQADLATVDGQFVGIAGFEFTHGKGHLNVFNTDQLVRRNDPAYTDLNKFYEWLVAEPTAFAQFNHPSRSGPDSNFNEFAFNPLADQKIILQELTTSGQFFLGMSKGWHLGTLKNWDTHSANWGCCPLMGSVAGELTRDSIVKSLLARRTFFVSPSDSNLALVMRANGYWMGSSIPNTGSINFTINVFDPDPNGQSLTLALYENGRRVASTKQSSRSTYSWTPAVSTQLGRYYYAEAYKEGWLYPAYSSPVWVERPPLAVAAISRQIAPPDVTITLNSSRSSDPDGDALAYAWTQESGPALTIDQATPLTAQASFVTPATVGLTTLRLTVTDTGGLTAVDTVSLEITDRPILQLTAQGPAQVAPGQLFTYTLNMTNSGATAGSDVQLISPLPTGATYVSGGTEANGQVSWIVDSLPANGGTAQVEFVVRAGDGSIVLRDYQATCANCIAATNVETIFTNAKKVYLPLLLSD